MEESPQEVVNSNIQKKLEDIEHKVSELNYSLFKDNGSESMQSKVNRLEAEKAFIKRMTFCMMSINGAMLVALLKIAFLP